MCTVDIISAIEFDKTGEHLATGDRGGRVVLFDRVDAPDVREDRTLHLDCYCPSARLSFHQLFL